MSDESRANIHEFTVSELSRTLKRTVEESYSHVRVRGEISGLKRAGSGHVYFALKDADAVLDAVCWKGVAARLRFQPEDGLEMIVTGKLTTYPQRSRYQIVVDQLEHAGEGALMALLEERKKKLAAEGLFDETRKRTLPFLPRVIGVVTSPTGAVIRDILHRLSDRFPRHVLVWPVLVQGEGAAEQIAAAIRGFNELGQDGDIPRPDLLIVARGGGSLEDLWSFNEEVVVRAAAMSEIPLISAVGHETDTTLIDFAADMRAPTPTAAAEVAVPVRDELIAALGNLSGRMARARRRQFEGLGDRLAGLARGLPKPREILALAAQRLDDIGERLPASLLATASHWGMRLAHISGKLSASQLLERQANLVARTDTAGQRLERAIQQIQRLAVDTLRAQERMLEGLSHHSVLERGFAVIYDASGAPVTSSSQIDPGEEIEVALKDGRFGATVDGNQVPKARKAKPKAGPKRETSERQGRLL